MTSQVFFGSPRQARLEAKETLPAKLDLILEQLHVRDRVKDQTVAIKMHTGNDIGYSTVHPVFVRKVVQVVKEGGGKPFVCDCFGFTSMPILPDAGVFGSDDIVALDQAVLDMTGLTKLIEENIPTSMEIHTREGHPLSWLHGPLKDPYLVTQYGEQLGLGTREYELIDVLPVEQITRAPIGYIPAK